MSYDLMVFDPDHVPADRIAFMAWYGDQTAWKEGHGYNDPNVPTPKLRAWFDEIRKEFPPMNGPFSTQDFDNPCVTDYTLGQKVIYAAFAWSEADDARRTTLHLGRQHGLGFFDVSADDGGVWMPTMGRAEGVVSQLATVGRRKLRLLPERRARRDGVMSRIENALRLPAKAATAGF